MHHYDEHARATQCTSLSVASWRNESLCLKSARQLKLQKLSQHGKKLSMRGSLDYA